MRFKILTAALLVAVALPAHAAAKDIVLRPSHPTNRVVLYFHGAGGFADNLIDSPGAAEVVAILRHRGFAVAASDGGGPENWGNPESVADNEHLLHKLERQGYTRVFFFGGSMGGLDEMQMIGRAHPEAVADTSGVCNVRSVLPLLEPGVSVAWGLPADPPDFVSPVVPEPYPGLPVKMWASPEDTWVPKDRNTDVCASELRRRGAHVEVVATTGEHTNVKAVKPEAVPNFFSAIARRNKKAKREDRRAALTAQRDRS
jgi:alpha-beta hydrolase superfamily lysophospholipase